MDTTHDLLLGAHQLYSWNHEGNPSKKEGNPSKRENNVVPQFQAMNLCPNEARMKLCPSLGFAKFGGGEKLCPSMALKLGPFLEEKSRFKVGNDFRVTSASICLRHFDSKNQTHCDLDPIEQS